MGTDTAQAEAPDRSEALAVQLRELLGERLVDCVVDRGEVTLIVDAGELPGICRELFEDESLQFRQLSDLCGVDYLEYGQSEWATSEASASGFGRGVVRDGPAVEGTSQHPSRFGVTYQLLSVINNQRLRLRVYLDADAPIVATVSDLWPSANWAEREAFDLFGILFDGHPDLRRILTDYGFIGHPFRKDFPLTGHVEVRYDAEKKRVVYQPVSIEPRVLVPRVIRAEEEEVEQAATPAGDEANG